MSGSFVYYAATASKIRHKGLSFIYAGALKRTAGFMDDLREALEIDGQEVHIIKWAEALDRTWQELLDDRLRGRALQEGHTVLLWRPDEPAAHRRFETTLQSARPFSRACTREGANIAVVSYLPATVFAQIDGSSLLIDASPVGIPLADEHSIQSANPSTKAEVARQVTEKAWGSPALAQLYIDVDQSEESGNSKVKRARVGTSNIISAAVSELPISAQARLESLVIDSRFESISEAVLSQLDAVHLLSSGLLVDPGDEGVYRLACAGVDKGFRGLVDSLSRITVAPKEWQLLAEALFRLERLFRRVLWLHFTRIHGDSWQERGLGKFLEKAISVAEHDGGVENPEDLAMPLDWLSLGLLIELALETSSAHDAPIRGLSRRDIERMQRRSLPVRNRFAHMRLPRPTDLEEIYRAVRKLETAERSSLVES